MSSFLYSYLFGSAAEVLLAQPLVSLRNLPLCAHCPSFEMGIGLKMSLAPHSLHASKAANLLHSIHRVNPRQGELFQAEVFNCVRCFMCQVLDAL